MLRIVSVAAAFFLSNAIVVARVDEPVATENESGDSVLVSELERYDWDAVRGRGEGVLDELVRIYRAGDEDRRVLVAYAFYQLGWKSEEAAAALLGDVHTQNRTLRLSAQYALGRVSDSPVVVQALLDNMMRDPNPLFRDKAACALAYDQIHLSETQKVQLFDGLIRALDDGEPQVRAIAIQALQIHTGQTKGFAANLPEPRRAEAIARWHRWLDDYRAAL